MDSIYISPYITAYSEAGDDKPNDVTEADSVRSALYSLDEGVHTTPTQSTGTYVLSSRQCDGSGYDTDTDKMLQDMIEADTTGTASTSSPGSTIPSHRLSGSHSSISSIEDTFAGEQPSCGNEQDSSLKQHNEQLQEEKWTKPGGIPAKQIDSVFARDSAGLTSTVVQAPALYVESMPGKRIRDKAAIALNIWLQVHDGDLVQINNVINILHNASLILDDVEDGSISRRGRPATHMVFGTPQAINSAGYQINTAIMQVLKLENTQCVDIFVEEMNKLYLGQGHDLFWTFNTTSPSIEEYMSMVDYKTGALFNMLVRFMAAKSPKGPTDTPDLQRLVVLLGRYFQIRDDYMNLTSVEYTDQKGFCDDLDEGKFSLTLIHALDHATEANSQVLRHLLAQRHIANGMSLAQKHMVLGILTETGSLEYTVTALRRIGQEIGLEISTIEEVTGVNNRPLRALFEMLKV